MTFLALIYSPSSQPVISMASTSSWPNHYKYDVFLSFRGEDTRYSFSDHLYQALVRSGLGTFRDNDEIYRGQQLKPEIYRAIRHSRSSIIVLSQNYAKSRWCLDELVLILEQRWNYNHYVLPVFYHVDPSDVRNQRRSFTVEAKEGVDGSKWTEVNVNRWKEALTEVANLTGMVVEGPESTFIAEIVDTIDCRLDLKLVSTPTHLTGIENRAEGINAWLKNEQSNAEFLAICGMGGSGKTTLAQYIYNLNKKNFESSSFLQEIRKYCQQPLGLLGLQKQLLRDLLGGKNMKISNSAVTSKIVEIIQMKRVLIVLDDIHEHDELSALLGTKTFRTESKIIITTRLLNIHAWFGSASWSCHLYKLELLNDHESLELLNCHAFGSKIPMDGFEELTIGLAQYCEGNPLALKVLGSSLFVSTKDPRERNSIIEIWTSTMNSLASLIGDLDFKVQCILQKSYDSLPRDSHRELFLHIARFFVGEYEDDVVRMLEHDWHAKAGIMTLVNRCLLTISPNKKLMMHQLLQVMGRKIAREETNYPDESSRVWHNDEAYRVFGKGGDSNIIDGLAIDIRKLKEVTESLSLKTVSLTYMDKSKPCELTANGSYENFTELNATSLYKSSATLACRFSFAEIRSATKDFDDDLVIGKGGFGKVYKGQIWNEEIVRIVAIKRLHSMSYQGSSEFWTEIEVLSKLHHCHLVPLIGYCDDNKEMILVYEYMACGALDGQLHNASSSLKWVQRIKVAIGVGRGLDYLHTGIGTRHGVIHGDMKSSNILLDENMEAKISDFGLSKIFQTNHSFVETRVKGTLGYLDPVYHTTGILSRKTDVYAFGVVLYELLSGRLAIDQYGEDQFILARWAQKCVRERKLDQVTDSNIRGTICPKSLQRFSQIADRCLHSHPKERPTMNEVVTSLQGILELQEKYDDSPKVFSSKRNKYFSR